MGGMSYFSTAEALGLGNIYQQAARSTMAMGFYAAMMTLFGLAWFALRIAADWKIFSKAGYAGWKALIPGLNVFTEYKLCWNGYMGAAYLACTILGMFVFSGGLFYMSLMRVIVSMVLLFSGGAIHIYESYKLSNAFDMESMFVLLLILFGPIGRMILGFGDSEYYG